MGSTKKGSKQLSNFQFWYGGKKTWFFQTLINYFFPLHDHQKGGGVSFVSKLYSHDTDRGLLVSEPGVTSLLGCWTFKEVPAPDLSAIVDTDSLLAVGRKTENWNCKLKLERFFISLLLYKSRFGNAGHQEKAKQITELRIYNTNFCSHIFLHFKCL